MSYEIGQAYVQVMPSTKDFGTELKSAIGSDVESAGESAGGNFGAGFKKAGKVIGAAAVAATAAATAAVVGFGKDAVNTGMEFDSAMSQVAATMGVSVDEIQNLRSYAMDMGAKTAFSATQAAAALNYMALAGYDADTSMSMLPNVLNLAAAGGIDLAYASDMVTDASSALGLSIDETTTMVDQMAAASSSSNTSVQQLGEAFLKIGATARNVKGGTQELSTVLGVLADNGIKGSEGGTHLRNMLLSLQSAAEDGVVDFGDFNVQLYDADGNMRSLIDVIGDMQDGMEGMTQEAKDAMISGVFNKTDLASINALLGTSKERFEELGAAIEDCAGAAQQMADTQLDNLAGDITLFESALEGAKIVISDSLTPSIREFVQFGTDGITQLTQAFQYGGLDGAMDALGDILSDAITRLSEAGPKIMHAATELVLSFVDGISKSADSIASAAVDMVMELADGIAKGLPAVLEAGVKIVSGLISGIAQKLPTLINETIPQLLDGLCAAVENGLPQLMGAIGELVGSVVANLPELIANAIGSVGNLLAAIVEGVAQGVGTMIDGVKDGLNNVEQDSDARWQNITVKATGWIAKLVGIVTGEYEAGKLRIEELWGQVNETVTDMSMFQAALDSIKPSIVDANTLVSASGQTLSSLDSEISQIESAITETLRTALSENAEIREADLENISSYLERMVELENEKLAIHRISQIAELEMLKAEGNDITAEGLQQHVVNVQESLEEANTAADEAYTAQVNQLTATYAAMDALDSEEYQTKLQALKQNRDEQKAENQSIADEALEIAQQKSMNLIEEDYHLWDELMQVNEQYSSEQGSFLEGTLGELNDIATAGMDEVKANYVSTLADMDMENATAFFNILAETKSTGGEITDENKTIADTILSCYENLPGDMGEMATEIMQGLANGISDDIPEVSNASSMTADEIINTLRDVLGIHSPSTITTEMGRNLDMGLVQGLQNTMSMVLSAGQSVGQNAAQGIARGLQSQEGYLQSVAYGIVSRLTATIKSALRIHSPSKLYEDEIGAMMGKGIGIGFVGAMDDITVDMIEAMPTNELAEYSQQQMAKDEKELRGSSNTQTDYRGTSYNNGSEFRELAKYMNDIKTLLEKLTSLQLVLDSGVLVGELAEGMNSEFEAMRLAEARG